MVFLLMATGLFLFLLPKLINFLCHSFFFRHFICALSSLWLKWPILGVLLCFSLSWPRATQKVIIAYLPIIAHCVRIFGCLFICIHALEIGGLVGQNQVKRS